ncbi:MAG: hypothetical protein ACI4F0_00550 [Agathobacter sp.]
MTFKNFLKAGLTGWCIEITFTSLKSLIDGNFDLSGRTSLWMFPIYGMAVFFVPIYSHIKEWPMFLRSVLYGVLIMATEFVTGTILTALGVCPWCYADAKYSFHGVIRFDYFPLWMAAGLLFEYLLCKDPAEKKLPLS